jgi:predicted lipid-binding transport protein (Tim44 family)
VSGSRDAPSLPESERAPRSTWLPAPAFDEPRGWDALAPEDAAGTLAARWRISFFEAVMLGVVGGAVGGGILGGLNASGAVDTVLTVEFGAVFGIVVGVLIAVLLALASGLLMARRRQQSATSTQAQGREQF